MSVLINSAYNPSRGGHAPGDIREAFFEALDAYEEWESGEPEPTVVVRDRAIPISQVCGLVWNCTDVMPSSGLSTLSGIAIGDMPKSHTYAASARYLKSLIEIALTETSQ